MQLRLLRTASRRPLKLWSASRCHRELSPINPPAHRRARPSGTTAAPGSAPVVLPAQPRMDPHAQLQLHSPPSCGMTSRSRSTRRRILRWTVRNCLACKVPGSGNPRWCAFGVRCVCHGCPDDASRFKHEGAQPDSPAWDQADPTTLSDVADVDALLQRWAEAAASSPELAAIQPLHVNVFQLVGSRSRRAGYRWARATSPGLAGWGWYRNRIWAVTPSPWAWT
jgi:hypothetical protein